MNGQQIKFERLQLGLNQTQMAERLGVKMRTIRYYEKGERQIPKTIILLLNALKRNHILQKDIELMKKERAK